MTNRIRRQVWIRVSAATLASRLGLPPLADVMAARGEGEDMEFLVWDPELPTLAEGQEPPTIALKFQDHERSGVTLIPARRWQDYELG